MQLMHHWHQGLLLQVHLIAAQFKLVLLVSTEQFACSKQQYACSKQQYACRSITQGEGAAYMPSHLQQLQALPQRCYMILPKCDDGQAGSYAFRRLHLVSQQQCCQQCFACCSERCSAAVGSMQRSSKTAVQQLQTHHTYQRTLQLTCLATCCLLVAL
jgi:hypothetical protein